MALAAGPVPAAADALDDACTARIAARFRTWTIASVTTDVAAWAKGQGFDPVRARGDFDTDGRPDLALLVQERATPVAQYPERIYASRVAVCLNRASGVALYVVDEPYCADAIVSARKGERYFDFEREREGTFPSDGVRTICFKAAGATFLFEDGGFRRIVDGD